MLTGMVTHTSRSFLFDKPLYNPIQGLARQLSYPHVDDSELAREDGEYCVRCLMSKESSATFLTIIPDVNIS